MKHLILGTAGHVDHGKTSLVKALTGIDCDTHKEEKLRGITINLGFANLPLSSGDKIGIVDVPGHRDFVHTMVAGASGIDIALLVIAADGGIMPQTREHLRIMQILGIQTGIIALTRIDLVEKELVDIAEEEIREFVRRTFLENCPIVKVSSKTGEGIDDLKRIIDRTALNAPQRPVREIFRMYIDRIFSVSGFGTVVTGSVLSGTINSGKPVYLLPGGKELRIRRIERHGVEVTEASAGDRASINLAGLSKDEFTRGMLIADRPLHSTSMVDAELRLFEHGRTIGLWSSGIFLMGTFEAQARVHLLDRDILRSGDVALVQIHLPRPCIAQSGDKFVLRGTSSDYTLGGGEVMDAFPLHHRRRSPLLIQNLERLAEGKLTELAAAEIRKHIRGITLKSLAEILNTGYSELTAHLPGLPSGIVKIVAGEEVSFITDKNFNEIKDQIIKTIDLYHKRNPLESLGRTLEELLGILGMDQGPDGRLVLEAVLKRLENSGDLRKERHTWVLKGHGVDLGGRYETRISLVEEYFRNCGLKTPLIPEVESHASGKGIDPRELKQILRFLVSKEKIHPVEGTYIHASIVNENREKLLRAFVNTPEGFTVAQFRDLIGGNRKICLLLLAIFDNEGLTSRTGDIRVITGKGKDSVADRK